MYRLTADQSQLSPHVGHKVELSGSIDASVAGKRPDRNRNVWIDIRRVRNQGSRLWSGGDYVSGERAKLQG